MNVAVMKTKAETALAEEFDRIATKLPGGRAVAASRREAMAQFRQRGFPHRRVEEWKYTDLRTALKEVGPLVLLDDTNVSTKDLNAALGSLAALDAYRVVLVNGHHRAELSKLDGLSHVDVRPLAATIKSMPDDAAVRMLKAPAPDNESMASLNAALATDELAHLRRRALLASIGECRYEVQNVPNVWAPEVERYLRTMLH